jgi:hypothetical protein
MYTPILLAYPPSPKRPYKFLQILDETHHDLVEAGLDLKSISEMMNAAVKNNPMIKDIGLYSPNEHKLANLSDFLRPSENQPEMKPKQPKPGTIEHTRRIEPRTKICWQCKQKKLSDTELYWYDLSVYYSKDLIEERNTENALFAGAFLFVGIVLSFVISSIAAKRLGQSVIQFERHVRTLVDNKDFTRPLPTNKKDSLYLLLKFVDITIKKLYFYEKRERDETAQNKFSQSSKQLMTELRTPLAGISTIIENKPITKKHKLEIEECITQATSVIEKVINDHSENQVAPINEIINDALAAVQDELKETKPNIQIDYEPINEEVQSKVSIRGLRLAIKNMIEATATALKGVGNVSVKIAIDQQFLQLQVTTSGEGLSTEYWKNIVNFTHVFSVELNPDIALYQAFSVFFESGGGFTVDRLPQGGTAITATLPRYYKDHTGEV